MPEVDASRPILSAAANYQAADWGTVSGGGSATIRASADLKRGIDLQLGAEALIGLDASVSKFLSIDVQGQASAAAGVRAQIQVPLDLFDEAGLAIRLQAVAEAAAGIQLGIGLDIGEFLELAQADSRMQGVPMRLLKIFLDEVQIQGGVMAKAAAAAMAYVNVAVTGRLIDTPKGKAGFTVSAEAGLGLKAGAGFRVFAGFDLRDPGKMIRRTVDAVVDDTLQRIAERTADPLVLTMLDELKAPAKMALRMCFELGTELARGSGNFDPAQAPAIAQRCVQVFCEEAQRYLIQKMAELSVSAFTAALQARGFSANAWNAAKPQRLALASRLRAMPSDPFEPIQENKDYWAQAIDEAIALALALGGRNQHTEPWVMPLASLWAASQLLFVSVGRISSSGARASLLGTAADTQFPPFSGATLQAAPPLVRSLLASLLPASTAPRSATLEDLVALLTGNAVLNSLIARFPGLKVVVEIIGGPGANSADVIRTLMRNLGPFVAQANGRVDPQRSLELVLAGLQRYVNTRLEQEVKPALHQLLANQAPEVRLYLDEVLLATLRFATDVILVEAAHWAGGNVAGHKAMRECCSALVMQVLGRTLVVSTDVLLFKAMQSVSGAFLDAVPQLNRRDGAVDQLVKLVPVLNRNTIKDTVEEIFGLAADVFKPLTADKRSRIRDLLYEIIDTTPSNPDRAFLEQLKNDSLIPNAEAATALALELGGIICDNFTRLIGRILELLGQAILEALEAVLTAIEHEIGVWIGEIQGLLEDIGALIQGVLHEIEQLERDVAVAADALLDQAEAFLGVLASGHRGQLRTAVKKEVRNACLGVLADFPGYSDLPREARDIVKDLLDDALSAALDNDIFDDLAGALGGLAGELEDFLEDIRAIDPSDDVAGALIDLLVDRIEDLLRDTFGSTVGIRIKFKLRGLIDIDFDLGTVGVRTDDLVSAVRHFARELTAITSAAHELGEAVTHYLGLEQDLDVAEVERDNLRASETDTATRVQESKAAGSLRVLQPGASAAYGGDIPVEIALMNVPRSFLGPTGEDAARVFVFLDEAPVDLALFEVTEGVSLRPGIPLAVGHLNIDSASVTRPAGTTLMRLHAPVPKANPVLARRSGTVQARQVPTWSVAPAKPMRGPEKVKTVRGRAVQIGGKLLGDVGAQITPGRRPRLSINQKLLTDAAPSLTLRMQLAADGLSEGFHTLAVVLTTGTKATRVSESVAFYASAKARVAQPPLSSRLPVAGLPARITVPPEHLAPALRALANQGAGKLTRIGPAPKKSARIMHASAPATAAALEVTRGAITAKLKEHVATVGALRGAVKDRPLKIKRRIDSGAAAHKTKEDFA